MLYQMMGNWDWWGSMMSGWGWAGFAAMGIVWSIIVVLAAIFWIWMIIDCLMRSDERFPRGGKYDKVVWILVLIFTNILGAILYYLIVKRAYQPERAARRSK